VRLGPQTPKPETDQRDANDAGEDARHATALGEDLEVVVLSVLDTVVARGGLEPGERVCESTEA
jgi:hypothetical protein